MPTGTIGGSFRILSARQRRACARAGRRDGRAGLPAGEPKAGMSLPGADAVTGEFTAAIAVVDREYRDAEAGALPTLLAGAAAAVRTVAPAGTAAGPEARSTARAEGTRQALVTAAIAAADQLLEARGEHRATVMEIDGVRRQALDIYTAALLRRHPDGHDLSARGWRPAPPELPDWVTAIRPDLSAALTALDIAHHT